MFILHDNSPLPEIKREIDRLQNLLQDLTRAKSGQHPSSQTIANAPALDNWQVQFRPEPCLVGTVHGHPHIQDGHFSMTSGVWLLAPTLGYARTLSRVYALGRPASSRNTH